MPIADAMTPIRDKLNCALAVEVLRKSGTLQFRAMGSSMIPSLWPGDILNVRATDINEIRVGEIVLFERNSSLCAHRVLNRAGSSLVTRGDSLPAADSPVTAAELLGRVVAVHRDGTDIRPAPRLRLPSRIFAWLARHSERFANSCVRCHRLIKGHQLRSGTDSALV